MMYGIFGIYSQHTTRGPEFDPLTMGKWFYFEGNPHYETQDLDDILREFKEVYGKKVSRKYTPEYRIYNLYYILDRDYNIIATLDFDGNIVMNTNT